MNLDIRDVAIAALHTVNKENKTIISWDEVARYAELLEKKFDKQITLISKDDYDNESFLDNVYCYTTSRNVYFSINPNIHPKQFKNNIEELLLNGDETIEFMKGYKEEELKEAKKLVLNEFRNEYLVGINSLDEYLGTAPESNIFLSDFMAAYILEYSRLCGNVLNIKQFETAIQDINLYLNSKGIHFINPDSFSLLVFLVNNRNYISKKDNSLIINIDNVEEFNDNVISKININLQGYIKKLAQIYIIDSVLDPEEVFENKKDI